MGQPVPFTVMSAKNICREAFSESPLSSHWILTASLGSWEGVHSPVSRAKMYCPLSPRPCPEETDLYLAADRVGG